MAPCEGKGSIKLGVPGLELSAYEAAQGVVRAGVSKAEFEAPGSKSSLCADLCRKWVSDWARPSGPGPTDYRSLAPAAPTGLQIAPLSVSHKS